MSKLSLEEAIDHAQDVAEGRGPCAADHEQLAGWLRELKAVRDFDGRQLAQGNAIIAEVTRISEEAGKAWMSEFSAIESLLDGEDPDLESTWSIAARIRDLRDERDRLRGDPR